MKKTLMRKIFLGIIFFSFFVFSGCETTKFDSSALKANNISLPIKLPSLTIKQAEDSESNGASQQVETSSKIYTVFRREVEQNICNSGDPQGQIELVLVENRNDWDAGLSCHYSCYMEFEVTILNNKNVPIWKNTYSGTAENDDWNMFWNGCLDTALLENTQLSLLHTLLDKLKADLSTDYQEITTKLSE